jgi:hypothetical protein
MSWKPQVQVRGEPGWHSNALRFATRKEAEDNAHDLWSRWTLVTNSRAIESEDPVNYVWLDGRLRALDGSKPE